MPPKKPQTEEDKRWIIRQEGRIGNLVVENLLSSGLWSKGRSIDDILQLMDMQVYAVSEDSRSRSRIYYGYCPLFEPRGTDEPIPTYTIRVDLSEGDPIIEVFQKRRG